jgi:hypothetical protein
MSSSRDARLTWRSCCSAQGATALRAAATAPWSEWCGCHPVRVQVAAAYQTGVWRQHRAGVQRYAMELQGPALVVARDRGRGGAAVLKC